MGQILTGQGGNLITWTNSEWSTPGEYVTDNLRLVVIDIPEGYEPSEVTDFGPASSEEVITNIGPVMCHHIYNDATVALLEID